MRYLIKNNGYGRQDLFIRTLSLLLDISLKSKTGGVNPRRNNMAKYPTEVKDKAVAAAKTGMHLKEIQRTIGPNPKATMRYLAKLGIDYKKLVEQLKAQGKGPQTTVQISKAKAEAKASIKPVVKSN